MIKVAHIVTRINMGGLTTFLYNYYKNIDRTQIKFDIIAIDTHYKHSYQENFEALGSNVYYMPDNIYKRAFYLLDLFKSQKYDIVHVHIEVQSGIYLLLAKYCGVKVRIAHAHWSRDNVGFKNTVLRTILNRVVTLRAGASELAIEAVFGKQYASQGKVIRNAVDLEQFKFNSDIRKAYRQELGLADKFVLGFVGRLTHQKNIPFLTKVFIEIANRREDAVLLIIGDGEDKDILHSLLQESSLLDRLVWLKERDDVNNLFNAMDIMLLPSHYEGLPLVLVESQASSVHAIVSDKITQLVNITPYISYLPINESNLHDWANLALQIGGDYARNSTKELLTQKNFNIEVEAQKMLHFYQELLAKHAK